MYKIVYNILIFKITGSGKNAQSHMGKQDSCLLMTQESSRVFLLGKAGIRDNAGSVEPQWTPMSSTRWS